MFSSRQTSGSRPELRLFQDDEAPRSPEFLTRQQRELIDVEPRLLWTWRQFYENWFLEAVLKPRDSAKGTRDTYENMLRYWEHLTCNPPLILTDDEVCIDFVGTLPDWGWSCKGVPRGRPHRIGLLSEFPSYWSLAEPTIKSHRDRLATLIRAAGPRYDPSDARARILREVPYVPIATAEWETKPSFTLEEARQIAAAAKRMNKPELPEWLNCELWWQTRLALFYFTGLRSGTVLQLRWKYLVEENGETRLKVPGEIVKTGKATEVSLHPQLCLLLSCVRAKRGDPLPDELILPPGCGYRHFLTLHTELQELAGISEARRQSPHAWRRTHGVQIDLLGATDGDELTRRALDHSHVRVSRASYIGDVVMNFCRLRFPPLF